MPTARGAAVSTPGRLPTDGLAAGYANNYPFHLHFWGTSFTTIPPCGTSGGGGGGGGGTDALASSGISIA